MYKVRNMPIYEFICNSCGKEFEQLLSSTDISSVSCDSCKSSDIKKVLSASSFKVRGSSLPLGGQAPAGCGGSGFS